jgi:hypothetical protein
VNFFKQYYKYLLEYLNFGKSQFHLLLFLSLSLGALPLKTLSFNFYCYTKNKYLHKEYMRLLFILKFTCLLYNG